MRREDRLGGINRRDEGWEEVVYRRRSLRDLLLSHYTSASLGMKTLTLLALLEHANPFSTSPQDHLCANINLVTFPFGEVL